MSVVGKPKKSSVVSATIVIIVVLLIIAIFVVMQESLDAELEDKKTELAAINDKIEDAKNKTVDLQNEIEYRSTDEYIEEEARGLGLIDPEDIIIKPTE